MEGEEGGGVHVESLTLAQAAEGRAHEQAWPHPHISVTTLNLRSSGGFRFRNR